MDQDLIKHDNAISSWITLRVARDAVTTTVLRIETNLSLDAQDLNYPKGSVDSLIAAAVAYVDDHPHINTIEIEPNRQGGLEITSLGD